MEFARKGKKLEVENANMSSNSRRGGEFLNAYKTNGIWQEMENPKQRIHHPGIQFQGGGIPGMLIKPMEMAGNGDFLII